MAAEHLGAAMSTAPPLAPPVAPASLPGPGLYQRFGPGLWSTVIHLSVAVLLALVTIGSGGQRGDDLVLTTAEELPRIEPEELVAFEFDTQIAKSAAASAADYAPVVVEEIDSLTELAVEAMEVEPTVETFLPTFGSGSDGSEGKGQGRARLFGIAGEGSKFAYVFDRSGSMTTKFRLQEKGRVVRELTPLELAKAELLRSLQELTAEDQFQLVFYNMTPLVFTDDPYLQELMPASDEFKAQAEQFVADVPGQGGTNHLGALLTALKLKPEVIFLITDGERKDDLAGSHVRSLVKICERENVTIHLIHFGARPRPNSTLVQLATKTGGMHRFIGFSELAEVEGAAGR